MNNLNVLLLDDEKEIHEITKRFISDIYVVYSAYTYEGAVKLLDEKGIDFFNIFICDLYLADKEKSGLDFIKDHLDCCKTIVTSGYLTSVIIDELIVEGVFAALPKPVNMDSLIISMNSIIRCE
jgi:DNA-binding NtrC family response regulator